jgi:hypothetical protein
MSRVTEAADRSASTPRHACSGGYSMMALFTQVSDELEPEPEP